MTTKTTPRGSVKMSVPPSLKTQRLVLRAWRRTDAPILKAAIDANLDHLRAFMLWAKKEPSSVQIIEQRIDKFDQRFRAESEWTYAIFSSEEKVLYGGAGLHRSTEKATLEIGFWLGKGWTKQGYATEAAKALADLALALPGIDRVEIRCDARNAGSIGVATRAGFAHIDTIENHVHEPGAPPRTTVIWERTRAGVPSRAKLKKGRGFWGWLKSLFG